MRLLLAAWLGTAAAWTAAPKLGSSRAAGASSSSTRSSMLPSMLLEEAQGPEALLRLCAAARSDFLSWRCPSSAPVPPQGEPGGSGRLGSPRKRSCHRLELATSRGADSIQVPRPIVGSDARAPSAPSSPRSCATWRVTHRAPMRPCSTATGGSCTHRRRRSTARHPSSGRSSRQP